MEDGAIGREVVCIYICLHSSQIDDEQVPNVTGGKVSELGCVFHLELAPFWGLKTPKTSKEL